MICHSARNTSDSTVESEAVSAPAVADDTGVALVATNRRNIQSSESMADGRAARTRPVADGPAVGGDGGGGAAKRAASEGSEQRVDTTFAARV